MSIRKNLLPILTRSRLYALMMAVLLLISLPALNNVRAQDKTNTWGQDTTKSKWGQDTSRSKNMTGSTQGDMKGIVTDMQKNMMSLQTTGDPDYDFASVMIEHHNGAVNLAKEEIAKGTDQDVVSFAQTQLEKKNTEINDLQDFVKNNRPADNQKRNEEMTGTSRNDQLKSLNEMNEKVQTMDLTGSQDKDYISLMILHHQSGIDMAKEYLDRGKSSELRQMAQKMIDDEQSELDKLKSWQDKKM